VKENRSVEATARCRFSVMEKQWLEYT